MAKSRTYEELQAQEIRYPGSVSGIRASEPVLGDTEDADEDAEDMDDEDADDEDDENDEDDVEFEEED